MTTALTESQILVTDVTVLVTLVTNPGNRKVPDPNHSSWDPNHPSLLVPISTHPPWSWSRITVLGSWSWIRITTPRIRITASWNPNHRITALNPQFLESGSRILGSEPQFLESESPILVLDSTHLSPTLTETFGRIRVQSIRPEEFRTSSIHPVTMGITICSGRLRPSIFYAAAVGYLTEGLS